jgi:hypothetical protein
MRIVIETIPNADQRYPTVGDWWWTPEGNLEVRISDMGNWKYEFLVAYHELLEAMLCKDRGITIDEVDAFDKNFEEERERGLHTIDEEPGYAYDSPYKEEHFIAESVERIAANQLKVDWNTYEKTVMEL